MLAGGISEAIMHFVGYLRIIDDTARDRIEYDGPSQLPHPDDYLAKHPVFDGKFAPDDIDIDAVRSPRPVALDDLQWPRHHPLKLPDAPPSEMPDEFGRALPSAFPPSPGGGGGGGGGGGAGGTFHISVTYQSGGEQDLIDIRQHNTLYNNNLIGDAALAPQAAALNAAAWDAIRHMADNANAHIPHDWWMPPSNTGVSNFLNGHDHAWADRGGTPDAHSVHPGYYVNGVQQSTAPVGPDLAPLPSHPAAPDLGHGFGQWADLGGNFSLNAALIGDVTQSARTMVVEGDYFKTNAIFQTNSMVAHHHFSLTGGTALPALTGGDTMNNFANFVQHPGIYATVPAHFAGPLWSVDVVHGSYYNVHVLVQTNYLSNNDVVAQQSNATHYEIHAGGNSLENLTQIFDGNIHYDLIVVTGAYHGMNVIFQNNILLSESEIRMIADGINACQSASGGHNALINHATIDNYGGDKFHHMNGSLESVASALQAGNKQLDPSYGSDFAGSGGTIHVLYVTGDYYDVNAVWQTNVTSNVSVMAQLIGAPPAALAAALHQNGPVTQSVIVGHNSLTNDAAIVDVGPTNIYVGGHAYTDAVLVQANLLPDVKSQTLAGDTHTLVPELVAFVTDSHHSSHADHGPPTTTPAPHEDPVACVMH